MWSWWPWALVSVWGITDDRLGWALGAGAMALLAYVTAPAALPPRFGLSHEFDIESDEFLATIAGASSTPFVDGNAIELLNNGDAFYPRMLEAIEGAEVSITVEAYIYWAGEIGQLFARGAGRTRRRRSHGQDSARRDRLGEYRQARSSVRWKTGDVRSPGTTRFTGTRSAASTTARIGSRSIIDGRIAFTGGAGIADHWRGDARGPDEWRDMQVRVEGPAVTPLQAGFAHNWQKTTGELLSGATYYPTIEPAGHLSAQTLMSSPESGGSTVRIMYYLSIVCARKSIYIANPYFIPDAVAIETLIDAKQRGIDVRIMVSGDRNDNWLARQNSVRLYGRLLKGGYRDSRIRPHDAASQDDGG